MAESPLVGRFDQQTMPLVRDLLTAATRRMRTLLINRVGFDIPVTVCDVEFSQFGALKAAIRDSGVCLLARFRLVPADIPCLVTMDAPLLFRLFGLLLGEDPYAEPTPLEVRDLTDTDKRIAKRILDELLRGLEDSLPPEANQRIVLEEIASNPRIHLGMPPNTGMIDSKLDFGEFDEPMGSAHVIMPTQIVEKLWSRPIRETPQNNEGMARVLPLQVEAIAELARIRMPLNQLNQLDIGSVLEIGQVRNIEVRVADRATLIAQPGSREGVRCFRVVRKIEGATGIS